MSTVDEKLAEIAHAAGEVSRLQRLVTGWDRRRAEANRAYAQLSTELITWTAKLDNLKLFIEKAIEAEESKS